MLTPSFTWYLKLQSFCSCNFTPIIELVRDQKFETSSFIVTIIIIINIPIIIIIIIIIFIIDLIILMIIGTDSLEKDEVFSLIRITWSFCCAAF